MSLKVLIEPAQVKVKTRSGTNAKGKPYTFRTQMVWVYKAGSQFPKECDLDLPADKPPYPEGEYLWDIESIFTPDRFAAPSLDTREGVLLEPVTQQKKVN